MVPYSQRRHRLNPGEIEPVHDAALVRLRELVEVRDPGALDEAGSLFRVWYRIHHYVRNKPSYPPHDTYELISTQLPYGTVSLPKEVVADPQNLRIGLGLTRKNSSRAQEAAVWWFDSPEEADENE